MPISLLDGFIFIILVAGLVRGIFRGALRQITSLVGVLLAFTVAVQWMEPAGAWLGDLLSLSGEMSLLVGFVALFAGVQLVVTLLTRLVETLLDALALGIVNQAAGGLLGLFKASLLLSVLFLALSPLNLPDNDMRDNSRLYAHVAPMLPDTWNAAADTFPNLRRLSKRFWTPIQERLEQRDERVGVET